MNKLGFFIAIAFCQFSSTVAFAQESPIRECTRGRSSGGAGELLCTIVENGTVITDIILNRGACLSAKQYEARLIEGMRMIGGGNKLPSALQSLDKPYKFGEKASIPFDQSCNIIEANLITNKGSWTFKW